MWKLLLTLLVLGVAMFAEGRPNKRWPGRAQLNGRRDAAKGITRIHPRLARRWMTRFCPVMTKEENEDTSLDIKQNIDKIDTVVDIYQDNDLERETRDLRMRRNRKDRRSRKARGRRWRKKALRKIARKASKKQRRIDARSKKRLQRKQIRLGMLCKFLEEKSCDIPDSLNCPVDVNDDDEKIDIEENDDKIVKDQDDDVDNENNDIEDEDVIGDDAEEEEIVDESENMKSNKNGDNLPAMQ